LAELKQQAHCHEESIATKNFEEKIKLLEEANKIKSA